MTSAAGGRTVDWDGHGRGGLVFAGAGTVRYAEDDLLVVHVSDLARVSAGDLQRALRRAEWDLSVRVSTVPLDLFDEDASPVEPWTFELSPEGRLVLGLDAELDAYEDDPALSLALVGKVLAPLARRHRFAVVEAGPDPSYGYGPPYRWAVTLAPVVGGRPAGELFRAAAESVALLDASAGGALTLSSVVDLLRAGMPEALVGAAEGPWFDVKRQHYDLATAGGKIALAKDVASFANGEHGGLVAVGLEAKKVPGGEVVRAVTPVRADRGMLRKYQSALELHLFPPPDDLAIETVEVDGGMLLLVHLPPQPEDLKPFLVHGATVDGRTEGAFISVVRRRGDTTLSTTAPALHATLAAGRALLRRGVLPAAPEGDAPPAGPPADGQDGGRGRPVGP